MTTLPKPSSSALNHSEKLAEYIRQEIDTARGQIDFARFMDLVLYAPGLGYYAAGAHKFGRSGDFVTAPEISPLFAKCVARQFQQIFSSLTQKNILEFGAGSGIFAKDVLLELKKLNALPDKYYILEISAQLRDRQVQRFKTECPEFLPRVIWLDSLPSFPFNGIIFANEVLDAMPIHRFEYNAGEVKECYVTVENNQFMWRNDSPSDEIKTRINTVLETCELPNYYRSEISLIQSAWIQSVADILQQGVILLIDYGYGRREYYHPERQDGTLKCFYQHHSHNDPFILVGLQDITAHVDFTYVAESADQAGLKIAGFTTQAAFLLACGLLDISTKLSTDEIDNYKNNQAIKTLTLPSQMGEIVKVMALSKHLETTLTGFELQDRRRDL